MNNLPNLSIDPGNTSDPSDDAEDVIHPQHEMNTSDGGEFLDDGIRMHEQPYGRSDENPEECI